MSSSLPDRYAPDQLAFYIAASDHEMLRQVNQLLQRSGYVGLMDTAGRVHYLVDGRRGSPFACNRILEAAGRILNDRERHLAPVQERMNQVIDQMLAGYKIRQELKGYRYLRCLLLIMGLDDTKIRPISKTLYPAVAQQFHVSSSQVERDIRYAFSQSSLRRNGQTATALISRLYHELVLMAENVNGESLYGHEKPSEGDDTNGGHFTYE